LPNGIIVRGVGGFYYVKAGECEYECKARGIFRKKEMAPLPGDKVEISVIDENKKQGLIDKIHERERVLIRPAVANINQLIAVVATNSPAPDLNLLDKMLINAEYQSLKSVICVNKTDLGKDVLNEIRRIYRGTGYRVIGTSSMNCSGIGVLNKILKGKISVFAGQSGVGKSTLLNKVAGEALMETGSLSCKLNRGKHTTRHTQLIALPSGGLVADTPGFSFYELTLTEADELQNFYPEFSNYIGKCRFNGCSHIDEPDCAIKNAVEEGSITRERYSGYSQHFRNIKNNSRRY
jgi:ribosome biogenesis GTPase